MINPFCCITDANELKEDLLIVCWGMHMSYEQTNNQLSYYRFNKLTERQYVEHFEYLDRHIKQ